MIYFITTIREGTMVHRCAQKKFQPHPTSRTLQIIFHQTLQKSFNLNFIDHLKRILTYQSNRIVTKINVIYTNTKLVSVWDPMAHLK